jgi:redox-sensitive bicupin YhaK (pirin superfamily)
MKRQIKKIVKGNRTTDGAGVNLLRVIGHPDVYDFDPFLMLDAFNSRDPNDYIKGFPWHPHRGIETVTYLIKGDIEHSDSLGNSGSILDGCCQWMTAGGGILHQEMPKPCERMLGVQLWLNLPAKDKMTDPKYRDITADKVLKIKEENADIKIISGKYKGNTSAILGDHVEANFMDVTIKANSSWRFDTKMGDTVFIYILEGNGYIYESDTDGNSENKTRQHVEGLANNTIKPNAERLILNTTSKADFETIEYISSNPSNEINEKSAVLFTDGDYLEINTGDNPIRFLLLTGAPLHEPIAWGGPIVMNTREELHKAFEDLDNGTFVKM